MAIKQRLSEPFDIVSINDEELIKGLDYTQHKRYAETRDISIIPADILSRCTIFKCKPLVTEYEYILTSVSSSDAAWVIFQKHVVSVKNFDLPIDPVEGVKSIYRDRVPMDIYQEIAGVIIGKAKVDTVPFIVPPTLFKDRQNYLNRLALDVKGKEESANE